MHLDSNITTEIVNVGLKISSELEKIIQTYKMSKFLSVSGHPSWKFLNWSGNNEVDASSLKTYFMQEMFKKGILVLSTHNNSLSLTAKIADRVINTYGEVISDISKSLSDGSLLDKLQVDPVQPVIKLR